MKQNNNPESLDKNNAEIIADLIADPQTTDQLRVKMILELLESREGQNFFKTMMEEGLSYGACPCCGHENHWGVPEDILNQMGWVSYKIDPEVPKKPPTIDECPQFQEACQKKKVVI
jgi:hypothetical protein